MKKIDEHKYECNDFSQSLDELAREGAQPMRMAALEAESDAYVQRFSNERDRPRPPSSATVMLKAETSPSAREEREARRHRVRQFAELSAMPHGVRVRTSKQLLGQGCARGSSGMSRGGLRGRVAGPLRAILKDGLKA